MNPLKRYSIQAVIILLPLAAAALLAWWGASYQSALIRSHKLNVISVHSSAEMKTKFERLGLSWPPETGPTVPRFTVRSLPGDLDDVMDLELRKSLFIRALLPSILAENQRIRDIRNKVASFLKTGLSTTGSPAGHWLQGVMETYRVKGDIRQPSVQRQLLRRLDIIPPSLVLAQAANESGWGTSRFAVEGNNLFGIWTYEYDRGLIPTARAEDMEHAVRRYPNIRASVRAYLYTLNIGGSYRQLRILRERMRQSGQPLDAHGLVDGLVRYSQRGVDYVDDIRNIIERNQLQLLDNVELYPVAVELVMKLPVMSESKDG